MLSNDADILTMRNKFTSECLGPGIQEIILQDTLLVLLCSHVYHGITRPSAFRRFFCRFNMAYLNYEAVSRYVWCYFLKAGEWTVAKDMLEALSLRLLF